MNSTTRFNSDTFFRNSKRGRSPLFLKSAQFVAICRSQVWSGAFKRNIAGFLCPERNCWQGEEFRWLTSYQWTWRRSVLRARRKVGEALERHEQTESYFSPIELEYIDEKLFKWLQYISKVYWYFVFAILI